ncbi:hypothetical protein LXL04_037390 [Taraxacum kok-saghyz]
MASSPPSSAGSSEAISSQATQPFASIFGSNGGVFAIDNGESKKHIQGNGGGCVKSDADCNDVGRKIRNNKEKGYVNNDDDFRNHRCRTKSNLTNNRNN